MGLYPNEVTNPPLAVDAGPPGPYPSVMYYHAADYGSGGAPVTGPGLPMTPSVAFRSLFEQLRQWDNLARSGRRIDVYRHFLGPITPPLLHRGRAIGDPVYDAVAEYAALVVGRAGLLTKKNPYIHNDRLSDYARHTRCIVAMEHSLAIDLVRVAPETKLQTRQLAARAVLSVAAFWGDRCQLEGLNNPGVHALLGARPDDQVGAVLWEHAVLGLTPPRQSSSTRHSSEDVIDFTIGIGLPSPA